MVSVKTFLANLEAIHASDPRYRIGGVGDDGTCDCIGAIMGAMYRAGHAKYAMHSSNYFAREQMVTLRQVADSDLTLGLVVYKGRLPGGSGYDLNDRYRVGGRYNNGDMTDYYHVGVVTSISPLAITHCTKYGTVDGFEVDTKRGKWQYGGIMADINYEKGDDTVSLANKTCVVIGGDLKLRQKKSATGIYLDIMPEGAEVEVSADDGTWATVTYYSHRKGKTISGYAMSQYLEAADGSDSDTADEPKDAAPVDGVGVWIPTNSAAAADALAALFRNAVVVKG